MSTPPISAPPQPAPSSSAPGFSRKRSQSVFEIAPQAQRSRTDSRLNLFYAGKIFRHPKNSQMIEVTKVDSKVEGLTCGRPAKDGVRSPRYTPIVKKSIRRKYFKYKVMPDDLVLVRDPQDPKGRYLLGKVVSVQKNDGLNLDLTDDEGNVVPYYVPMLQAGRVFMETILPISDNPKELLKGIPTSKVDVRVFGVKWKGTLTAYHVKLD